LYFIIIYYY